MPRPLRTLLYALALACALLLPFMLCACSALAPNTQERAQPSTYVLVSPVVNYIPGAGSSPSTDASQWADTKEGSSTQEGTADTDAPTEVTVPGVGEVLGAAERVAPVLHNPTKRNPLIARAGECSDGT